MPKEISFIHAADLHLDSLFKGMANTPEHIFQEMKESTFRALDRLVQTAIEKKVDFVLIVGDLFDNEAQSLKSQIRLKKAFELLNRYQIQVYMSYGNHDYINGNIHPVTFPDNVFIFTDEQVRYFIYEKDGEPLAAIYGFSYENRAVHHNKIAAYEIQRDDVSFHVATLHGSLRSNTTHDVYAPFQLMDLTEKDFHYWALGHIHSREVLKEKPPIVYPGNIQGRNRKETGKKGCYHVLMSENNISMSFIPLQSIEFTPLTVDVSACTEAEQIEPEIQMALNGIQRDTSQLIDLTLVSDNPKLKQWENDKYVEDMIELINETATYQQEWMYIFRITIQMQLSEMDMELAKGDHFIGELSRHFAESSILPFMKPLYQQKSARKFVDLLTTDEEREVKLEAKSLLLHELLKERGE
jgi:DNA repair exonuclease SbcCD nuclease subunit